MNLWYVEMNDHYSGRYLQSIHMTYKGALKSVCYALLSNIRDSVWVDFEDITTIHHAETEDLEVLSTEELEVLKGSLEELGERIEVYSGIETATLQP